MADLSNSAMKKSFLIHAKRLYEANLNDKRDFPININIVKKLAWCYKKFKTTKGFYMKGLTYDAFAEIFKTWIKSSSFTPIAQSSTGGTKGKHYGNCADKGQMAGRSIRRDALNSFVEWDELKLDVLSRDVFAFMERLNNPTPKKVGVETDDDYTIDVQIFGKDEPHSTEKLEAGRVRCIANPDGIVSITGAFLWSCLKEIRVKDMTLSGYDLNHAKAAETIKNDIGGMEHTIDVSTLDWTTTYRDHQALDAFYCEVFGKNSMQVKYFRVMRGMDPRWKVVNVLPGGERYDLKFKPMWSGGCATLFENSFTMIYTSAECGAILEVVDETNLPLAEKDFSKGVKLKSGIRAVGDDVAVGPNFLPDSITLNEFLSSWEKTGKRVKWDEKDFGEPIQFCSAALIEVTTFPEDFPILNINNADFDTFDFQLASQRLVDLNSSISILQNMNPKKSIMRLAALKDKEAFTDAFRMFCSNFAFYNYIAGSLWGEGDRGSKKIQKLLNDAEIPYEITSLNKQMANGAFDRIFRPCKVLYPLMDVENE
jgi:hypothetical protein